MWLCRVRLLSKAGTLYDSKPRNKGSLVYLPSTGRCNAVMRVKGVREMVFVLRGKERAIHESCKQEACSQAHQQAWLDKRSCFRARKGGLPELGEGRVLPAADQPCTGGRMQPLPENIIRADQEAPSQLGPVPCGEAQVVKKLAPWLHCLFSEATPVQSPVPYGNTSQQQLLQT